MRVTDETTKKIIAILKSHGVKIELGAQYSVKCQIAQLLNAIENITILYAVNTIGKEMCENIALCCVQDGLNCRGDNSTCRLTTNQGQHNK
jgi:hypothetical protein